MDNEELVYIDDSWHDDYADGQLSVQYSKADKGSYVDSLESYSTFWEYSNYDALIEKAARELPEEAYEPEVFEQIAKNPNAFVPSAQKSPSVKPAHKPSVNASTSTEIEHKTESTWLHHYAAKGDVQGLQNWWNNAPDTNINEKDATGRTALHYAANKNHPDMIIWLIQHGANVKQKDNSGNLPIDEALSAKNMESVNLLGRAIFTKPEKLDAAWKSMKEVLPPFFMDKGNPSEKISMLDTGTHAPWDYPGTLDVI